MIALTVHRRGEPHDHRAHASLGHRLRRLRAGDARVTADVWHVLLGPDASGSKTEGARGDDQRPAGASNVVVEQNEVLIGGGRIAVWYKMGGSNYSGTCTATGGLAAVGSTGTVVWLVDPVPQGTLMIFR